MPIDKIKICLECWYDGESCCIIIGQQYIIFKKSTRLSDFMKLNVY